VSKPTVIVIVGPTGSGKSALGAYIADKLGGEIVSADSRQVYKGMRVISRAEPGHMVGVVDPKRQYSAGQYAKAARKVIAQLHKAGTTPVIVGGTGFFVDSLTGRMTLPDVPPNRALRKQLSSKSPAQLFAQLKKLDPVRAANIDPHNPARLVRAIEVAKAMRSGKNPEGGSFAAPYNVLWLGLPQPKNLRAGVEARLKAGMLAEAKKLRATLSKKRYAELGFEFALLADYLDKKISKAELVDAIANGERKYAIRQMRWFKRNQDIHWVTSKTEALRLAKQFVRS
jgi:tRNA dimethylallyltransferase